MAESGASPTNGPSGFTVGSLLPGSVAVSVLEGEGSGWRFEDGTVLKGSGGAGYTAAGAERLTYNNPFGQEMERVWFDGKVVYAIELGEVDIDVTKVKVAQEYQIVYAAELDHNLKLAKPAEKVPGQLNIYDSVPGMEKYSPLWQFNYVIVPRGYAPNTLRSERDCLSSGYPIIRSNVVEN